MELNHLIVLLLISIAVVSLFLCAIELQAGIVLIAFGSWFCLGLLIGEADQKDGNSSEG